MFSTDYRTENLFESSNKASRRNITDYEMNVQRRLETKKTRHTLYRGLAAVVSEKFRRYFGTQGNVVHVYQMTTINRWNRKTILSQSSIN